MEVDQVPGGSRTIEVPPITTFHKICSYCRRYVYIGFFYKCTECPNYFSCQHCLTAGKKKEGHKKNHTVECVKHTTDDTVHNELLKNTHLLCPFCKEVNVSYNLKALHRHVHSVHSATHSLCTEQLGSVPYESHSESSDESVDLILARSLLEDGSEKGMYDSLEFEMDVENISSEEF